MESLLNYIVSPVTHEKLTCKGNKLYEADGKEYKIIKNVPVLLPEEYTAQWHRELIEVILWEYPDEIERLYEEVDWKTSPVPIYIKYIKELLHDKQGIISAFEGYSKSDTQKWIIEKSDSGVSFKQKFEFSRHARKSNGKKRTESKIDGNGIFKANPYFGKTVNKNSPETIVELGTGAGGGTASVALHMSNSSKLFTVDIGFECLGNAIGIRKYQKKKIIPVCANFWYLPFADSSIDSVCTFNGLDESRETERTVVETARILKSGGTFTVTSRKNAFMRQAAVLKQFDFSEKEALEMMKKCRLFCDTESLCELCKKHKLILKSQKEFEIRDDLIYTVTEFVKT